jgi:hypothetical protein
MSDDNNKKTKIPTDDQDDDNNASANTNDDQKHQAANNTPANAGESSLSGSTTDLEADDNALDAAQAAGLYEEADEEHPMELNLAAEIEKDERLHVEED